jgi:hypothetical protein
VHPTGRQKEHIILFGIIFAKALGDSIVGDASAILVGSEHTVQTGIQICTILRSYTYPHLSLSGTIVTLARKLIIGMHLHRKVIGGINELYQKRELVTETLCKPLSHDFT